MRAHRARAVATPIATSGAANAAVREQHFSSQIPDVQQRQRDGDCQTHEHGERSAATIEPPPTDRDQREDGKHRGPRDPCLRRGRRRGRPRWPRIDACRRGQVVDEASREPAALRKQPVGRALSGDGGFMDTDHRLARGAECAGQRKRRHDECGNSDGQSVTDGANGPRRVHEHARGNADDEDRRAVGEERYTRAEKDRTVGDAPDVSAPDRGKDRDRRCGKQRARGEVPGHVLVADEKRVLQTEPPCCRP